MNRYPPRDDLVTYVRRTLMGPMAGETEVVKGTPFLRYMTGILFPQGVLLGNATDAVAATADDVGDDAGDSEEIADDIAGGVDLASEQLPSAVGISFKVADDSMIRCLVWGACYERASEARSGGQRSEAVWTRVPLAMKSKPEVVEIQKGAGPVPVFGGRGRLTVRWRTRPDASAIVTVALVNAQLAKGRAPDPALALFQVGLRCEVKGGIDSYPRVGTSHVPGSEDAEVEFLYREVMSFARGHGAAANWGEPANGRVPSVEVDFTPSVDVPRATFEVADEAIDPRCCDIRYLTSASRNDVVGVLDTLASGYATWAEKQRAGVAGSSDPRISGSLVERIEAWAKRMLSGVERLRRDDVTWLLTIIQN